MSTELIKVTINSKDFHVPKGARLIDVCRENQFDIPSFCYYADLALQASCRMCLVRIEKMPKLQTSCTIICTDGMVVDRKSTRLNSSHLVISYAVFCLRKKTNFPHGPVSSLVVVSRLASIRLAAKRNSGQ